MARSAADRSNGFRQQLDPYVEAAEIAQLAMIISDARVGGHPVVYASDGFLEMTGDSREALLGKALPEILGAASGSDKAEAFLHAFATDAASPWELQLYGAGSTEIPARVTHRTIRDDNGTIDYNLFSFVDLSGNSDHQLSRKHRALYENAPGFIATSYGPDHRFSFANASYRAFVGRDKLVGLTVAEVMPEIVNQGIVAVLDEVYRSGQPFIGADMPLRIGGMGNLAEPRYIDVVYQPMRNGAGEVIGLFCEGYDVTARHVANAEIAALQAQMVHLSRVNAMGTMASTLAHEINQPLCAISNYVAGVRSPNGGKPDEQRLALALEGIEEASRRAADIVRHLRDQTSRREPARTRFALKCAVEECVRTVGVSSPGRTQFINQIHPDETINADKIKVQQVIINLLTNANEAVQNAERRSITISARKEGDAAIVGVADTGPGVPSEAAETLFSWSKTTKVDGMGLGLSICRTIVEMHRGKIWLEKSDASGSEFRFSLPGAA